jgi:hypothetical protein
MPFSITPVDATSPVARTMLVAYHARTDAFGVGADHDSGHVRPSEIASLRNSSGYIPQSWSKARTQLRSVSGLLGALLGDAHLVLLAYGRFLRLYDRMETRLESELDHAYGCRLGPALMVFHVLPFLSNWYMQQLDVQSGTKLPLLASAKGCTCSKCRSI